MEGTRESYRERNASGREREGERVRKSDSEGNRRDIEIHEREGAGMTARGRGDSEGGRESEG